MGKTTVESSLRLDAHYWAKPVMCRIAAVLAERFRQSGGKYQPGQKAEDIGLMPMAWNWTSDKSPAGNIRWAVLDAEGGKVQSLLLLFCTKVRGESYARKQEVWLSWETPAGDPALRPVLLCPFCSKRCRYLCAAYPGRQGGPYAGEFACRVCAGLCYAAQLEYKSKWVRNFDAVFRLAALAQQHPERLTEKHLDQIKQANAECRADIDKRLSFLDYPPKPRRKDAPEEGRLWEILPASMTPRRRGRPSQKKARWQARECAKIVRQAERDAKPKRLAGRPKVRRAYNADGRQQQGCAGLVGAGEGYCLGCRAPRLIAEAAPFTASNGRGGIKGQCADCGRGLCRMGSVLPLVGTA